VTSGAHQRFDFTKGKFAVAIVPTFGTEITGGFQAGEVPHGTWLDALGQPEAFACATYEAAAKG
jgi:hypothetical protein